MDQLYCRKILFVCSRNRRRSLTAEHIFAGQPGIEVRSAGTQPQARVVVTQGILRWADLIFVMEKSHLRRLQLRFPELLQERPVITLHIEDRYDFMQPELMDELRAVAGPYLLESQA